MSERIAVSELELATRSAAPHPPPQDPAPPPPASRVHDLTLEPPERGDVRARRWYAAGLTTYLILAVIFIGSQMQMADLAGSFLTFFGLGASRNYSVFVLVIGGMMLMAAAVRSVRRDLEAIGKEEDDVDWVIRHKRDGVALVLAPAGQREQLFREGHRSVPSDAVIQIETLVDDRVRRSHAARMRPGASVSVEELRVIAERRTASLGGFARYVSSLLLLLAVLGTFAGVKTALPGLIDAVTAAGTGASGGEGAIVAPLRAVSDAFGANALALIGAIALGLMAHGVTSGRRNLLERLELVSSDFIYGQDTATSADPLQAAVQALNRTAAEINQSSGAFLGIESGLESLGSSFRDAFNRLDDSLRTVVQQHHSDLYKDTSASLDELRSQVTAIASAVRQSAQVYAGLVARIDQRADETDEAIRALRTSNEQLTRGLEGLVSLGEASRRNSTHVIDTTRLLTDTSEQISKQVTALAEAMDRSRPTFEAIDRSLQAAAERVEQIDERAVQSWTQAGEGLARRMDLVGHQLVDAMRRSGAGAKSPVPASRGWGVRPWILVALPLFGTLAGAAAVYLLVRFGLLSFVGP